LLQCQPTSANTSLELLYCFRTYPSTCFGPYWSIIKEHTVAENNRPTPFIISTATVATCWRWVERLFYATVRSLMMGRWGGRNM